MLANYLSIHFFFGFAPQRWVFIGWRSSYYVFSHLEILWAANQSGFVIGSCLRFGALLLKVFKGFTFWISIGVARFPPTFQVYTYAARLILGLQRFEDRPLRRPLSHFAGWCQHFDYCSLSMCRAPTHQASISTARRSSYRRCLWYGCCHRLQLSDDPCAAPFYTWDGRQQWYCCDGSLRCTSQCSLHRNRTAPKLTHKSCY